MPFFIIHTDLYFHELSAGSQLLFRLIYLFWGFLCACLFDFNLFLLRVLCMWLWFLNLLIRFYYSLIIWLSILWLDWSVSSFLFDILVINAIKLNQPNDFVSSFIINGLTKKLLQWILRPSIPNLLKFLPTSIITLQEIIDNSFLWASVQFFNTNSWVVL